MTAQTFLDYLLKLKTYSDLDKINIEISSVKQGYLDILSIEDFYFSSNRNSIVFSEGKKYDG